MSKAKTYITDIRRQVATENGGIVPKHLELTIRNYAAALETRDLYRAKIQEDGPVITESGSMGQMITRQHPLCGLLYQQEMLCLSYSKALGATSAKAATKTEAPAIEDNDPMKEYYSGGKRK